MSKQNSKTKLFISNSHYMSHISKLFSHHSSGITLVALVVTIVVLLILAGVTITSLLGDDGIIKKAGEAANKMNEAIQTEQSELNALIEELNNIMAGHEEDDTPEEPDMPEGWNPDKVTVAISDDGIQVPVPIGFTASTIESEKNVSTGFVIKQGPDGSATSGINEFVWVPVSEPSTMFGTDSSGNSLGKLYNFGTSSSPNNPPTAYNWTETEEGVMSWTATSGNGSYREPDIVTYYDGNDASDSSYFTSAIGNITGAEFKVQLQQELEDMRDSVETYGGFYIGRYETGGLSGTAVVQKNNTDINNQNWYVMYNKCKTIAQETQATSSMIWGCQWDATLRWFLESDDPDVVTYVTNSSNKGNYSGSLLSNGTGSNDSYSVNNIYDMAGNVYDWTLEANGTYRRVLRRGSLRRFRFQQSSFWPRRQQSEQQQFQPSVVVPHFM